MITAKDVHQFKKDVNKIEPKSLDKFIVDKLYPKFTSSDTISIPYDKVPWTSHAFIASMQARGFSVEYICEDHPAAIPYFKISLPPQGE